MTDRHTPTKPAMSTGNYREQLTWRDAATGRLLAETNFFEPLTIDSLTPPSLGGHAHFPTINDFVLLQVRSTARS